MTPAIRQVAVIVPAHDEEELIPGCLSALRTAAGQVRIPVRLLVVLDDCRDGTEAACRRYRIECLPVRARNVGRARDIGARHALRDCRRPAGLWLAHTDADSRVGPTWIADQIRMADHGADAVVGLVHLDPAAAPTHARHQARYHEGVRPDGSHDHVHGANLGVRASAYAEAGGFPPLTAHEDRELVRGLTALAGVRVVRSSRTSVETSSRRDGRCAEGFAATLAALSAWDGISPGPASVGPGSGSSQGAARAGTAA